MALRAARFLHVSALARMRASNASAKKGFLGSLFEKFKKPEPISTPIIPHEKEPERFGVCHLQYSYRFRKPVIVKEAPHPPPADALKYSEDLLVSLKEKGLLAEPVADPKSFSLEKLDLKFHVRCLTFILLYIFVTYTIVVCKQLYLRVPTGCAQPCPANAEDSW
jgi:hypothetical protein